VNEYGNFEEDALWNIWNAKPVKTGEHACYVFRMVKAEIISAAAF